MQCNMQVEGTNIGGLEQASSSNDGQFLEVLKEMIRKEIEVMVVRTIHEVILRMIEDLVRKIVKEEFQSVEKRLSTGGTQNYANEMTMPKERSLQLKFPDKISVPVLTGEVLKGEGDNSLKVALVDRTTEQVVTSGPESSAKVEILVLDASGDDSENNWTRENFKSRVIEEGDKKKPHFAKNICIYLKEGVGTVSNAKLGQDSSWMKNCKCRLGARVTESFRGIEVQEAWTESFMVSDKRGKLYKKHHPPSLSDKIWRLENIGKDGAPCQHLNKNKIRTVQDFLFLHSVNPQKLEQIASDGTKMWKPTMWKATVDHAQTCIIDDKKMYLYCPSTESKMGVIFDAVGGLKGVIHESHYVPIENLSAAEKVSAKELLLSAALEDQKNVTPFDDEASILRQFPYRSSDINAPTNSSTEEGPNGNDLIISENIDGYYHSEPGTSSQSISPSIRTPDHHSNIISHFGSPGPTNTGQLYDTNMSVPIQVQSCQLSDLENVYRYAPTDPGTSSQSISPYLGTPDHPNSIYRFGSLESTDMGQLLVDMFLQLPSWQFPDLENINEYASTDPCTSSQSISRTIRTLDLPDNSSHFGSVGSPTMGQLSETYPGIQIPSCQSPYPDSISEPPSDNWSLMSLVNSRNNNLSGAESHSQQSNDRVFRLVGRVVNAMLWGFRVKRKARALGGNHVPKKPRI